MSSNFEETFRQLKIEFADSLNVRRAEIEDGWTVLRGAKDQPAQKDAAETVQLPIHYLVGAGATFGYDSLSEIARPLDVWLRDVARDQERVTDDNLPAMTEQLDTLLKAIDDVVATASN